MWTAVPPKEKAMIRWTLALTFIFIASVSAKGQDNPPAAFPDDEPPAAAAGDPKDIKLKLLRKNLGARDVKWVSKSGLLELFYDFRKGQEKDWEIASRVVPATAFRGIRIGAGDTITHKVKFSEATCVCRYSCNISDAGPVMEATQVGRITTRSRNIGRCFQLNGLEKSLGRLQLPPKGNQFVELQFVVADKKVRLIMNHNTEVADEREASEPFQFIFHGGNNGSEFGEMSITGKPDAAWLAGLDQE